jgi:hypothetical protein
MMTAHLLLGGAALLLAMVGTPGSIGRTPPPSESSPVWRAQLRIAVCDVQDAKTDDPVKAELNESSVTWLDYARNDFERGSTFTYDLLLSNVSTLADITKLRVAKTGDNGVCLESLTLKVNGKTIFSHAFSPRRWLDGSHRSVTFSSAELRGSAQWAGYTLPIPSLSISRSELESRIEAMAGTFIHGNDLYWGRLHGRGVEVSRKSSSTIHGDLDLAYRLDNWFDPEVDIDFDVRICKDGQVSVAVQNVDVDVDSPWYAEILSLGIAEYVDQKMSEGMEKALRGITVPVGGTIPSCPTIQSDGSLQFSLVT